jgi:hypothetical protein
MAYGSNFKKYNCCAVFLLAALVGILIAAVTVDWYKYSMTYQASGDGTTAANSFTNDLNSTQIYYGLEGQTTTMETANGPTTNTFQDYETRDNVKSTFQLVFAFTLIALLLSGLLFLLHVLYFADAIRNKALFVFGMTTLRILLLTLVVLVLVSVIIAFLGFLGITSAFSDDTAGCTFSPCRKFSDSTKNDIGSATCTNGATTTTCLIRSIETWGPVEGWYLVLVCIPLTVLLAIIVVVNKVGPATLCTPHITLAHIANTQRCDAGHAVLGCAVASGLTALHALLRLDQTAHTCASVSCSSPSPSTPSALARPCKWSHQDIKRFETNAPAQYPTKENATYEPFFQPLIPALGKACQRLWCLLCVCAKFLR